MTLYKCIADINGGTQVAMTADEETAFLAAQAASQTASAILVLKSQAQTALDKSDITMIRCIENGVAVPSTWATYRAALRAIVSSGTGTMPTQPAYPAGT